MNPKDIWIAGDGEKVKAGIIKLYNNDPMEIERVKRDVVGKIPIILSQFSLQFSISALIKLPERALGIKNKNNKLNITQCKLLQETNSLFIKGFIRENMEYSTLERFIAPQFICGEVHHCAFDIPFQLATKVNFDSLKPYKIIPTTTKNYSLSKVVDLSVDTKTKESIKEKTEFLDMNTEYYHDLPYCHLINSRIINYNAYINGKIIKGGTLQETVFDEIKEKIVVKITLQILQKRYVRIKGKS